MPSVPDVVVLAYLRAAGAARKWQDAARAERHLADRTLRPQAFGPPRRLQRKVTVAAGRDRGWPVYTLTPRSGASTGTVLYAHGGGWVDEIALQHWQLCAQIAASAQTTVVVPIYPLIPFGSAEEVVGRFCEMAAAAQRSGPLVLAGDSAGGQISLSAALQLRDRYDVIADRTILISPGLDLTLTNPEIPAAEALDPWLAQPGIRVFGEHWRGRLEMDDPTVSPLYGEFAGLGPITIFTGTHDLLNPDTRLLRDRLLAAGVELEYEEREGLIHVYPLLPTAAGLAARQRIVAQVRAVGRGDPV